MGRRGGDIYSRHTPPGGQPTNRRIIAIVEITTKECGVWAPHWAPQHRSPVPGRKPQNVWLWRPVGLTFRRARGLWDIEIPLLKGSYKISHALGLRAEAAVWKEPRLEPPADLGKPPIEAGGNWSSPWGHRHWGQPFLGACSTTSTLVLESTILESSL